MKCIRPDKVAAAMRNFIAEEVNMPLSRALMLIPMPLNNPPDMPVMFIIKASGNNPLRKMTQIAKRIESIAR